MTSVSNLIQKDQLVKERIIRSAFAQFALYGIKSISMDAIAQNMSISKRTIYGYFNDKEELLTEGIDYCCRLAQRVYTETNQEQEFLTPLAMILGFYNKIRENPQCYSSRFYEDLRKFPQALEKFELERDHFAKECRAVFARGVKEGYFLPDVNYEILSLLVKDKILGLHPSHTYLHYSFLDVCDSVVYTFVRGICTSKGIQNLEELRQR